MRKKPLSNFLKNNAILKELPVSAMSAVMLLYFYAFIASYLLPQGINYVFVTRLYKLLFVPTLVMWVACFVYTYFNMQKITKRNHAVERFYLQDLLLVLLPMTPIVRYIILNCSMLSALDSVMVATIFMFLSFILAFLIPKVSSVIGTWHILMISGLSFAYTLFNMPLMAADFKWHLTGSFKVQFIALGVSFAILLVFYLSNKKILNIAVTIFFAANTLSALFLSQEIRAKIKNLVYMCDIDIHPYTEGRSINDKPDIFLLTFESYVGNETMLAYGIDNSEQENYLMQNGFYIYKGTYSLGFNTRESMTMVFNMRLGYNGQFIQSLSWLPCIAPPGSGTLYALASLAGDGAVQNILKDSGYETFGIFSSDYFFLHTRSYYDHSFPTQIVAPYKLLAECVFVGEFKSDAVFGKTTHTEYLLKKREVLSATSEHPRFVYTHSSVPGHRQNPGWQLGNEILDYAHALVKANEEMKIDIETINTNNPNSIIIVNGDHGPRLLKNYHTYPKYHKSEINQLEMQDRSGSFLAIKWPEGANIDHDEIKILQDIFPFILSYLYNDDFMLNLRIRPAITTGEKDVSDVRVRNGIIEGGKDDGKLLFKSMRNQEKSGKSGNNK